MILVQCVCVCACACVCGSAPYVFHSSNHHNQDTNYSITTKISLMFPFLVTANPIPSHHLHPKPMATTNLFSTSIILSFQDCHVNGIKQYTTFETGFLTQHMAVKVHPSSFMYQQFIIFIAEQWPFVWMQEWLIFIKHAITFCDQLVNVKIYTAVHR